METPVEKPLKILLAVGLCLLFFAFMNMFVKLASETLPVPQVIFFRNFLGLIPVLFLIMQKRDYSLFKTQRHSGHFVRSFVGFFSMCCFFWSFALLPLANATAIHFASPLIITALAVVLLDEKVGVHRWSAILVGLAAVLFMLQPAGNGDPVGSLIAMSAAILAAFAMIMVRKLGSTEHSLTIVFYFTAYSSLFSFIWMLFVWEMPDLTSAGYLLAVGLLGGCGQICLTYAYARAPAAFVSAFSYLGIVVAATLDYIVWNHVPGWQIWVGSMVVIGSGLYIVWREARKKVPEPTPTEVYSLTPEIPTQKDLESPKD
jgi:drug/metabolite transporter (DMT)-like permease